MDKREFIHKIFKIIWRILHESKAGLHQVDAQTLWLLHVLQWYPALPFHKLADVVSAVI